VKAAKVDMEAAETKSDRRSEVKKCDWQPSNNTPQQSPPAAAIKPARQTPSSTNASAGGNGAQTPASHWQPPVNNILENKSQSVPFSWGYFGVSGR
jgi:hypothetical protein